MLVRAFFMTSILISTMFSSAFAQNTSSPSPATVSTAPTTPTSTTDNNNGDGKEFEITDFKAQCIKNLRTDPVGAGDFGNHISFGPTIAAKAFNYDLASNRVAFNAGI